jgi:hypothetical protein
MEQPLIGDDLHAGDGILMYWSQTPIAPWQDERWLAEMRRSLRPSQYARMIENRWVASAEQAFVSMEMWDRCVTGPGPLAADKALPVYVGVDASSKLDSSAIAAVTFDRKAKQVRLVAHKVFVPTANEPVNFEALEAALLDLHRRFSVRAVLFDPWAMQASAQRLKAQGLRMQEFPQTAGNLTSASAGLYDAIVSGNLVLYPDAGMRAAASQAVTVESARGLRIGKANVKKSRIDVVIALAMAVHAAVEGQGKPRGFLELDGWQEEKVTKNVWEHPSDRRQRETLDRVRAPVAMVPVDVIMQQLGLTDRQQRMLDRAVETVPMPMRTSFMRAFADRLAPMPADGAVDAAIDLARNALRREEAA